VMDPCELGIDRLSLGIDRLITCVECRIAGVEPLGPVCEERDHGVAEDDGFIHYLDSCVSIGFARSMSETANAVAAAGVSSRVTRPVASCTATRWRSRRILVPVATSVHRHRWPAYWARPVATTATWSRWW